MMRYDTQGDMFGGIPTVVKNLLIINGLFFLFMLVRPLGTTWSGISDALDLHFITSPLFKPWQLITHMFMHAGPGEGRWYLHILMNMLGLFMFGPRLEYRWGSKRFLTYYMLCGIGAALIYMGWMWIGARQAMEFITADELALVKEAVRRGSAEGVSYAMPDPAMTEVYGVLRSSMRGASGAIYGLLVAFGMAFPNVEMFIMFIPFPIKAKWMVVGFAVFALYSGVFRSADDNVAHFAHLGGMAVGFLLFRLYEKKNTFYDDHWR